MRKPIKQGISTFFALMAEYNTSEIPLENISEKFFGLGPEKSKSMASKHKLPIPAHRCGSQKSKWLINAVDLASFIDKKREDARIEWERVNNY